MELSEPQKVILEKEEEPVEIETGTIKFSVSMVTFWVEFFRLISIGCWTKISP